MRIRRHLLIFSLAAPIGTIVTYVLLQMVLFIFQQIRINCKILNYLLLHCVNHDLTHPHYHFLSLKTTKSGFIRKNTAASGFVAFSWLQA